MLFLWQNGSGINAINYYSPTVFSSIGIRGTDTSFLTTGLFGVVKTCFTLIWLFFLIDRLGRRKLLLIGSIGGSICMWIIGGYLSTVTVESSDSDESVPLSPGGTAAVFFFYLWTAFYTPSWNGTPWVLNSEMFDQGVRSLGQASAAANNWFWNFIISRFTPQMFLNMGNSGCGVYFFFASMMLASVPFVFFLIPETKGMIPPTSDLYALVLTVSSQVFHLKAWIVCSRRNQSGRHMRGSTMKMHRGNKSSVTTLMVLD